MEQQALLLFTGVDNIFSCRSRSCFWHCYSVFWWFCEWQIRCWAQGLGRGNARMKRYKVPDHFRRGLRQAIGVGTAVFVGYLLLHGDRLLALYNTFLCMQALLSSTCLVYVHQVCTTRMTRVLIHMVQRIASLLYLPHGAGVVNGRCQGAICQAVAARRQVGGHHDRCRGQPCPRQGHTGMPLHRLGSERGRKTLGNVTVVPAGQALYTWCRCRTALLEREPARLPCHPNMSPLAQCRVR